MNYSKAWLQSYLSTPLPDDVELDRVLSSYAFEVESVERVGDDSILDVKVLPNRAGDCLSHRGMARELSALLSIPMREEEIGADISRVTLPESGSLSVSFDENVPCRRYVGAVVRGVKIAPSPAWLVARLEVVGQRSVNNVVDATNYIMLGYGQPMHAFDAKKLSAPSIRVRMATEGETFVTLSGEEKKLDARIALIADGGTGAALAMAGVKGGDVAAIDDTTVDLIVESANFDASAVRYASRSRQILTDSAKRFEADLDPELAREAMERCVAMIISLAGGVIESAVDVYPRPEPERFVALRPSTLKGISGLDLPHARVEEILKSRGIETTMGVPRALALGYLETTLDAPYVWDPSVEYECPKSFDCSALCAWVYWKAGVWIPPRKSVDQFEYCEPVERATMQAGDLIFANTHEGTIRYATEDWMAGTPVPAGVDHVGMYVGNGEVIHATRQYGKVVREKLDEAKKFKDITRIARVPGADEESWIARIPSHRRDLRSEADLVEEIMQQYGYNELVAKPQESVAPAALTQEEVREEAIRRVLRSAGFDECMSYAFRSSGVVELENPLASDKAFLRVNLSDAMRESLDTNLQYVDLAARPAVALFEIGTVFPKEGEKRVVCIGALDGSKKGTVARAMVAAAVAGLEALGVVMVAPDAPSGVIEFDVAQVSAEKAHTYLETTPSLVRSDIRYTQYSPYPVSTRDVALFAPAAGLEGDIAATIVAAAGAYARSVRLFDRFEKSPTEVSYGFRIAFQADDKTLEEADLVGAMTAVTEALVARGWIVR